MKIVCYDIIFIDKFMLKSNVCRAMVSFEETNYIIIKTIFNDENHSARFSYRGISM